MDEKTGLLKTICIICVCAECTITIIRQILHSQDPFISQVTISIGLIVGDDYWKKSEYCVIGSTFENTSQTKCASLCRDDPGCSAFSYDPATRQCKFGSSDTSAECFSTKNWVSTSKGESFSRITVRILM